MTTESNSPDDIIPVTLGEVYRSVQRIEDQMQVLVDAGLPRRVSRLEQWKKWVMRGLAGALGGLVISALLYVQGTM